MSSVFFLKEISRRFGCIIVLHLYNQFNLRDCIQDKAGPTLKLFLIDNQLLKPYNFANKRTLVLFVVFSLLYQKGGDHVREYQGSFGQFLVAKRAELGITGKEMAAKLGISHAYYNAFELGNRKAPEQEMQDRIADVFALNNDERLLLYDLAGKTRGIVAVDLPDYINNNPYVRVALRTARDSKASQEQWLKFIAQLEHNKEEP